MQSQTLDTNRCLGKWCSPAILVGVLARAQVDGWLLMTYPLCPGSGDRVIAKKISLGYVTSWKFSITVLAVVVIGAVNTANMLMEHPTSLEQVCLHTYTATGGTEAAANGYSSRGLAALMQDGGRKYTTAGVRSNDGEANWLQAGAILVRAGL